MDIATSRFGTLSVKADDVIRFPRGILGMEECREWILLADGQNPTLGWLQSTDRPHIALAVVSPRRFVPGYQIRVARRELTVLSLQRPPDAQLLVVVGRNEQSTTLNLKAPLVIHLQERLGCQVVAKDDHPVQYVVPVETEAKALRKSA